MLSGKNRTVLKIHWLDILPGGTLDGGNKLVDEFHWNISVGRRRNLYEVQAGHILLLQTDNVETVEAFRYGLAVAHSALPASAREQFKKFADESAGK